MIARKPLSRVLFSASLYLFVFLSIDREASLFGFDMRYVLIALMVPALFFLPMRRRTISELES